MEPEVPSPDEPELNDYALENDSAEINDNIQNDNVVNVDNLSQEDTESDLDNVTTPPRVQKSPRNRCTALRRNRTKKKRLTYNKMGEPSYE